MKAFVFFTACAVLASVAIEVHGVPHFRWRHGGPPEGPFRGPFHGPGGWRHHGPGHRHHGHGPWQNHGGHGWRGPCGPHGCHRPWPPMPPPVIPPPIIPPPFIPPPQIPPPFVPPPVIPPPFIPPPEKPPPFIPPPVIPPQENPPPVIPPPENPPPFIPPQENPPPFIPPQENPPPFNPPQENPPQEIPPQENPSPYNPPPFIPPPENPSFTTDATTECEVSCPSTQEYDPVCGTNGITYHNIARLRCAQYCGVDVQVLCDKQICSVCNQKNETVTEKPTILPEVQRCVDNCRSTPEYLPVCGTNQVTYNNIGMLICAKNCGLKVEVLRRSRCSPLPPSNPTTERIISLESFNQCMKSTCPVNPTIAHVCGSDRETYINIDRFNCAKRCGKNIELLCESPCILCSQTKRVTTKATPTVPSTTPPTSVIPTMSVKQCVDSCVTSDDKYPVCGSNNITYDNPNHLECAQMCGESVQIVCEGECSVCYESDSTTISSTSEVSTSTVTQASTSTSSTTQIPSSTSSETTQITPTASTEGCIAPTETPITDITEDPQTIKECIESCPTSTVDNPVCGSNNVTYKNPDHIVCAQICGERVIAVWLSACFDDSTATPDQPATSKPGVTIEIATDIIDVVFVTTPPPPFDEFSFDPR